MLAAVVATGCADIADDHHDTVPMDDVAVVREAVTLDGLGAGCSTAGTEGVSAQLLAEMMCLTEGRLVEVSHPSITLTSTRVHPFFAAETAAALREAADRTPIRLNSAFRTIAEQYVLWLGCSVAASPGTSNHETGRAIDVDNWSSARSALIDAGFEQPLPSSDAVHFEGPGEDLRSFSVLAFQRLWNANHPEDLIDEDGIAGTQTRGRLARTPAEGFAIGMVCEEEPPPAEAQPDETEVDPPAEPSVGGDGWSEALVGQEGEPPDEVEPDQREDEEDGEEIAGDDLDPYGMAGGCSAAPGGTGQGAGWAAVALAALNVLALRRNR